MKDNTALNIYILSTLLLEQLDDCEGSNIFRQKFKYYAKGLIKEVENFDKQVLSLAEVKDMHEIINLKRDQLV